ncbi:MAG: hypothetical protein JNJ45_07165 [Chthonomonas sp.]|nr:hypothetical protein [Chthonomonas sp.]
MDSPTPPARHARSPLPPIAGKIGLGLAVVGTILALALQIQGVLNGQFVTIGLLLGSAIYTTGAFLAAATYGYKRGTSLSIFFAVCRALIFASLMFGLMNIKQ